MNTTARDPLGAIDVAALKKKAGWSAIFLGGLGVHKFLLGYRSAGFIMLGIALVGWVFFAIPMLAIMLIGVVEGVLYLRKSNADFAATYLLRRREWF